MIKKSINLNLIDKKKKTNKKPRLHSKKNQGTSKKIKRKKNKTLKKGGMKRTRDEDPNTVNTSWKYIKGDQEILFQYLFNKHMVSENDTIPKFRPLNDNMLRRQPSLASSRKWMETYDVVNTWWSNSQKLICMIFEGIKGVHVLPIKVPVERGKKILNTNVFGEKLYKITLTSGSKQVKHFLKLLVGYSVNDVYTTIFLSAVDEQQTSTEIYGWYELFHISDHPGSSTNLSGAIHLKTILDINTIIETLRTFQDTPFVSFKYGNFNLRSDFSDQFYTLLEEGKIMDANNSLKSKLMKNTLFPFQTTTIKIDLNSNSRRLYLKRSYGRIGYIVDLYLHVYMSPVLGGLGISFDDEDSFHPSGARYS